MVEIIRASIRPAITFLLVGTLCGCIALFARDGGESAKEAALLISGPAVFVIEKWFESRKQERLNGNG